MLPTAGVNAASGKGPQEFENFVEPPPYCLVKPTAIPFPTCGLGILQQLAVQSSPVRPLRLAEYISEAMPLETGFIGSTRCRLAPMKSVVPVRFWEDIMKHNGCATAVAGQGVLRNDAPGRVMLSFATFPQPPGIRAAG